MKMRINLYTAVSAVFSIVTLIAFLFFSLLFEEQLILYMGIPFSLSTFFLFLNLLHPAERRIHFEIPASILKIVPCLITAVSILAVLFVPSFEGTALEWMRIPPLNWVRYSSALILTSFLPGYFLLKIIDREESIRGTATIVISYLLSLFVTFLIGFSILLTKNSIPSIAMQIILPINIILALVYYLANIKREKKNVWAINIPEVFSLLSILLTVFTAYLIAMYYNLPLTPGDMWGHHALAIQYLDQFPVYRNLLIPGYPYLYHIYLATVFSLSGIPSAITEQALCVLSFIPVLAFYSVVKAWFKEKTDKNIPIMATFLSTLLGFGSLYATYLKLTEPTSNIQHLLTVATSKTYDIYMRAIFLPSIVAPIVTVGLPAFLMLLFLLRKEDMSKIIRTLLMLILIVTGYLGHEAEIILFLLFFSVYSLLFPKFRWDLNAGILLGLIFVAVVDLIAPSQIYVFSMNNITGETTFSLPFLFSFFLALLTSVISIMKAKFSFKFLSSLQSRLANKLIRIWNYSRWLLLYVYVMSIITWLTVLDDFNLWKFGGCSFTPFFIFPLRLGAVGLLAALSIFAYLQDIVKDRRFLFFSTLITGGFLLEQASNRFPLFYPAYRYATYTLLGACVIAAYGIKRTLYNFCKSKPLLANPSIKKTLTASLLLLILILPGMITTSLFYVNASYYSGRGETITNHELEALNYIKQHLTNDIRMLTFSTGSSTKLETFASLNPVQNFKVFTYILLDARDPQLINYLLASSKVKYIYMAQSDYKILNARKGLFKDLLPFFPIAFENDEVTIYEVPPLSPPDWDSSFGIMHINSPSWIDSSFVEWTFDRTIERVVIYGSSTDDNIFHIWEKSDQVGRTWVCYSLSSLSLDTKIYHELSFRYRVEGNYTWLSIILLNSTNHWVSHRLHLSDKSFKTISFSLPENQIITRIEVYVGTMDNAPNGTMAHGYLDYIKITPHAQEQEAFPTIMTSMFQVPHSSLSIDLPKKPNRYALSFDGIDDYVVISDNASLDITDAITIGAWIYPNEVSGYQTIVGKRGYINSTEYCNYNLRVQDKRLKFFYKDDNGDFHSYMTNIDVFEVSKWYHVALTYISGDAASAKLYVNGRPVAGSWVVGMGNANLVADAVNLTVGCNLYIYDHEYFNGKIDEVRIFNRALSEGEVKKSFERRYAKVELGCVFCQRMEEGTGVFVKDESGYGNNGEIFDPIWICPLMSSYETALYGNYYESYIQNYSTLMLTYDPSDKLDLEGLLDWISNGGNLIVPNIFGNGFFGHLLQLHQSPEIYEANKITGVNASIAISRISVSPIVPDNSNLTTLLCYDGHSSSGFLFEKKYGSGRILYVNLHPLIKAKTVIQTLTLLQSNVDFVHAITGQSPRSDAHIVKYFPSYNLTSGETHIIGSLNLISDFISFKGNLNSIALPYNPETISEITVYGPGRINLYNASVSIFPSAHSSHLLIEAQSVKGEIVADGSSLMLIKTSSGGTDIFERSISTYFNASDISIIVLSPSVEASGKIVFDSLDVRVRPAVPLAGISRKKALIQGTIKFNTSYTTPTIVMFSSYQFDGTVIKMAEKTASISIPWSKVLTSPYHLLLLFSLVVASIIKRYINPNLLLHKKDSSLRGEHH